MHLVDVYLVQKTALIAKDVQQMLQLLGTKSSDCTENLPPLDRREVKSRDMSWSRDGLEAHF